MLACNCNANKLRLTRAAAASLSIWSVRLHFLRLQETGLRAYIASAVGIYLHITPQGFDQQTAVSALAAKGFARILHKQFRHHSCKMHDSFLSAFCSVYCSAENFNVALAS